MEFKKFMENNEEELHVFCDMDGVLTEWEDHFFDTVGKRIGDIPKKDSYPITAALSVQWWVGLPWADDGKKLWSKLEKFRPNLYILSSPTSDKERKSVKGKLMWLKREGIEKSIGQDHIIINQEKHKYVKESGKSILIDDTPKKINKWAEAGGIGILHTNTEDTLRQLMELGY